MQLHGRSFRAMDGRLAKTWGRRESHDQGTSRDLVEEVVRGSSALGQVELQHLMASVRDGKTCLDIMGKERGDGTGHGSDGGWRGS